MGEVYYPNGKPEPCFHCGKDCGGTCLNLKDSTQMKTTDPAYWMLSSPNIPVTPKNVHRDGCYICEDPEFAQMGLPLCQPCPECSKAETSVGAQPTKGHIPADDPICEDCGFDLQEAYYQEQDRLAKENPA
jgi:hypothetical protein